VDETGSRHPIGSSEPSIAAGKYQDGPSKVAKSNPKFYIHGGFTSVEQAKMLMTGMSSMGINGSNT